MMLPTTVPERIPVHIIDYDDTDDTDEPRNHPSTARDHSDHKEHEHDDDDDSLLHASIHSKHLVVEIETSPDSLKISPIPPSLSSAVVLHRRLSNNPHVLPARLSLSCPVNLIFPLQIRSTRNGRSLLHVIAPDLTSKKKTERPPKADGTQSRMCLCDRGQVLEDRKIIAPGSVLRIPVTARAGRAVLVWQVLPRRTR